MFKKLFIGAALSMSSLAFAAPHGAVPVTPSPHGRPFVAPAPDVRSDRFDVRQGHQLLRELDAMVARRDLRRLPMLDARIGAFIDEELREARGEARTFDRRERREERATVRQLRALRSALGHVTYRFDHHSLLERRRILVAAVNVAEQDLRDARQDRHARR